MTVWGLGAKGEAYTARSEKRYGVKIFEGRFGRVLMSKEYGCVAGDLIWEVEWANPSLVKVSIIDRDRGDINRQIIKVREYIRGDGGVFEERSPNTE